MMPTKDPALKRSRAISFKVTADEEQTIKTAAKRDGKRHTTWLREAALKKANRKTATQSAAK